MPTIVNLAYTGGVQDLTVPPGVESATLEVWGAQGVTNVGAGWTGGFGGYVGYTLVGLVPGETLRVIVGGQGLQTPHTAGYNGGGLGLGEGNSGGGGTDIRRGGTALANRIIVGGGGGGSGQPTYTDGHGGNAGYPTGRICGTAENGYAAGGTQTGPGPDLVNNVNYPLYPGSLGQGGNSQATGTRIPGAGGGGLWGGNTFGGLYNNRDGGGGGSSYYPSTDPNVTLLSAETVGTWTGNGKAVVTWADPTNIAAIVAGPMTLDVVGGEAQGPRRPPPQRAFLYVRDIKGNPLGVLT